MNGSEPIESMCSTMPESQSKKSFYLDDDKKTKLSAGKQPISYKNEKNIKVRDEKESTDTDSETLKQKHLTRHSPRYPRLDVKTKGNGKGKTANNKKKKNTADTDQEESDAQLQGSLSSSTQLAESDQASFNAQNSHSGQSAKKGKTVGRPSAGIRVLQTGDDLVAEAEDVLYENQRSGLFGGYSTKWLMPLMDKCGEWSQPDGSQCNPKDNFPLPTGWKWTSDWWFECNTDLFDSNGWQYAFSFWETVWYNKVLPQTFVRRRLWRRTRELVLDTKDEPEVIMPITQTEQQQIEMPLSNAMANGVLGLIVTLLVCLVFSLWLWSRVGVLLASKTDSVDQPFFCITFDGEELSDACLA